MKNHFLIPVLSTIFLSTNVSAVEKLDDVIVTATKTATTADQTIVPVVVVTSDDIKKSPAKNLVTLLSGIAGIDISSNGGMGQQSSVFVRGTESRHVLVLVDGIKVGSVTLGSTALEHIPLDQVEKIEIVKGPRSSLYGSDAIGGVIQIFTKKGDAQADAIKPQLELGVGTDETHKIGFSVSGGANGFSLRFGGSIVRTDGYNVMSENNPDADGYKSSSLLFNTGKVWDNGVELDIMALEMDGKNEYDNSYSPNSAFHTLLRDSDRSVKLVVPAGEKADLTLQLTESVEQQKNYMNGSQSSLFKSTRRGQSVQGDVYPIDNIILSVGFENQQDRVKGTTAYDNTKVDVESRYVQGQFDFGLVSVLSGYRHDDNSSFGNQDTWNIGFRISPLGIPLSITPSIGTAFKAPTINDLYWPADSWSQGNPNLLPETSKTMDIGIAWHGKAVDVGLNLYKTNVKNLISWQSNSSWIYTPVNIGKASIKGAELTAVIENRIANLGLDLAFLDAKDSSTNLYLARRAKKSIKVRLDKSVGNFDMAFNIVGYGSSYEDSANQNKIPGYVVVGCVFAYKLDKNISFALRGENLSNHDYATARGGYYDSGSMQTYSYNYIAPKRNFLLEMRVGL